MHGGGGGGGSGGDELGRRRAASDFRTYLRPWRDAPLLMPRLGRRVEVGRPHPVHPARNNTEGYSVQTGRATDTTAASGESERETENRERRQNVLLLLHASPCPAQLGWLFRTISSHRPKPALRQRCKLPAIARSPSHATATSSHDPIHPTPRIQQTTPRLDRGRPWISWWRTQLYSLLSCDTTMLASSFTKRLRHGRASRLRNAPQPPTRSRVGLLDRGHF